METKEQSDDFKESYPIICEFCDASRDHDLSVDEAKEIGWRVSWDGWVCPDCMDDSLPVLH